MMAYQITLGGKRPDDPDKNTEFHLDLVERAREAARSVGWAGVKVVEYFVRDGYASLSIGPGIAELSLDYLRTFRQSKKTREAA